ncbi:hypothetical protein, partial [Klebsiella pneumoniae]|uniref:hypothetical protein n=1 Tax=Klebsiella pneumoniae TaxID=573 RepID=UPI0030132B9B
MQNVEELVVRCFTYVFPDLTREEIQRANTASLGAWDSIAHITLLSTIGEESGQSFELEELEELVS